MLYRSQINQTLINGKISENIIKRNGSLTHAVITAADHDDVVLGEEGPKGAHLAVGVRGRDGTLGHPTHVDDLAVASQGLGLATPDHEEVVAVCGMIIKA